MDCRFVAAHWGQRRKGTGDHQRSVQKLLVSDLFVCSTFRAQSRRLTRSDTGLFLQRAGSEPLCFGPARPREDADVLERATALKRGGHEEDLSLEMLAGEDMYSWEPADESTPEKLYERTWAVSVLNTALKRLGELEVSQGRGEEFAAAEPFLSPTNSGEGCYQTLAERLGASETAARKMVSRLRQKFRDSLRDAIADTLRNPTEADVDDELRALKGALRN